MKCRGSQKRQVVGKKAKADEERVVHNRLEFHSILAIEESGRDLEKDEQHQGHHEDDGDGGAGVV